MWFPPRIFRTSKRNTSISRPRCSRGSRMRRRSISQSASRDSTFSCGRMFTERRMRMRFAGAIVFLLPLACATSQKANRNDAELEQKCREDVGHDPRCIEVLTKGGDELEAKEEVMRAEEQREDDAF